MGLKVPEIPNEALGAIERAATALARVEVASEPGGAALSGALIRRKAVALVGGGEDAVRAILLGDPSAGNRSAQRLIEVLTVERDHHVSAPDLLALCDADALTPSVRDALLETIALDLHHSPLVRAALAAGVVAAAPPVTREAQQASSVISDVILTAGGLTTRCRAAPSQLDAGTRSAAVQLERSGAWLEWIRAWCASLAREAATLERAVRGALTELAAERAVARQQHRIGATDELVLAQLQSAATFTIRDATTRLGLTAPTVGTAIERLEAAGVATELTGQKRDRIWTSTTLLRLSAGRQGAVLA